MSKLSRVIAKVVVFDELDNVLAIKRSMDDDWSPGEWETPGGKADDDEDFVAAAARELVEETGVSIKPEDLHLIYADVVADEEDGINRVWLFFTGRVITEEVVISDEHSGYQWLSLGDAHDLIEHDMTKKVLDHIKTHSLYPR